MLGGGGKYRFIVHRHFSIDLQGMLALFVEESSPGKYVILPAAFPAPILLGVFGGNYHFGRDNTASTHVAVRPDGVFLLAFQLSFPLAS